MQHKFLFRAAKLRVLAVMVLSAASSPSYASSTGGAGTVSSVFTLREGKLFFTQSVGRTARPSCATLDRSVIDVNSSSGQTQAALVLTALSQNRLVSVHGIGSCPDWDDTETVEVFVIES